LITTWLQLTAASIEIATVNYISDELNTTTKEDTFQVFRCVLEAYAPNFAKLFNHPGVRAVKLGDVAADTIEVFLMWLRKQHDKLWLPLPEHDWNAVHETSYYEVHEFLSTDMCRCILGGDIGELCINMFLFAKAYIPILRRDSINRLVLCFDPNGSHGLHLSDKSPIPTEAIQRAY
jgi:hypothetical protein